MGWDTQNPAGVTQSEVVKLGGVVRSGTTAQNSAYTGKEGEITYDIDTKQLHIHDGTTAGGTIIFGRTFAWNPGIVQELPTTSTAARASVKNVLTNTTGTLWYQELKSGELSFEKLRRDEQLLTNADWAGGAIPTSWTAPVDTGSRTVVTPAGPGANAIRFVGAAQSPYLDGGAITAKAGEVWIFAVFVEAVDDTTDSSSLIMAAGAGVTTISAPLLGNAVAGKWMQGVFSRPTDGALDLRFGLGVNGNVTGDITLSSPIITKVQKSTDVFGGWVNDTVTYEAEVPGVKITGTLNGNSVDANEIVTLATGATITDGAWRRDPAATNVETESSDVAGWSPNAFATLTDLGVRSSGLRAFRADAGTATNTHYMFGNNSISFVSGTVYTITVYLEDEDASNFLIRVRNNSSGSRNLWVNFDLAGGTVNAQSASVTDATIVADADGVFKCKVTWTANANFTDGLLYQFTDLTTVPAESADLAPAFTAANESIIHHGTQVEGSAYGTNFITTAGTTVTRAADSITDTTWPSETAAVVDCTVQENGGELAVLLGFGSAITNRFRIASSTAVNITNGVLNATATSATAMENERHKFGFSLKNSEAIVTNDEGNSGTDVTGTASQGDIYVGSSSDLSGAPVSIHSVDIYTATKTLAQLTDLVS